MLNVKTIATLHANFAVHYRALPIPDLVRSRYPTQYPTFAVEYTPTYKRTFWGLWASTLRFPAPGPVAGCLPSDIELAEAPRRDPRSGSDSTTIYEFCTKIARIWNHLSVINGSNDVSSKLVHILVTDPVCVLLQYFLL